MGARIETLGLIKSALWAELARATHVRGHAWRVLALATVDGARAAARNVVLREVRADHRQLVFYSDSRAPKVAQLSAHPLGSLLAWSTALRWQLRLEVSLSVADSGPDVSSRWAQVQRSPGAQDYLANASPGTPVDCYGSECGAQPHFAVVTAHVTAIDWLELHAQGHRRARFDEQGARWLAP